MGANPHANSGLLRDLRLPDFRDYAVDVQRPAARTPRRRASWVRSSATRCSSTTRRGTSASSRRTSSASNPAGAVLEVTNRAWMAERLPEDDHRRRTGAMEILSEHVQGWLEGYLLTGRQAVHDVRPSSTSWTRCSTSTKWLKVTREIPWRRPIASLNYLLTSHVWRQDHNGFSHQDPGFIDHVVNKKPRSSASTCRPTRTRSCP